MTEPAARPTPGRTPSADSDGGVDVERYARHLPIPGFGVEGQRALGEAKVLMVGAGGLGSPVSLYLAAVSTVSGAGGSG